MGGGSSLNEEKEPPVFPSGSKFSRRWPGSMDQYSLASMIVRTRIVFDGSAGSYIICAS
jgi:hypothetical protein